MVSYQQTRYLFVASLVAAFAFLSHSAAQAQVDSGPATDSEIKPCTVFVATGDQADKELDMVAERGDAATVYVFVQATEWDRPMARFLKNLDNRVTRDRPDCRIVAIWLTADHDAARQYLPRAQQSLMLERTTFAVFTGDKNGPNGWGLNSDARLTAVVSAKKRSLKSFGYRSINETDVTAVMEAVPMKN
jgi:hypothetical protein